MNIELKPIAESKVRQLGGDVCGVLVRTEGGVMAVSEHGRCTRLDAGVMGPVETACMSEQSEIIAELREYFDQRADAEYYTDRDGAVPNEEMQMLAKLDQLQAARSQGGQGAEVVAWCWENHGRHVTVDKSFAKELIADGEIVRSLVYGDTEPRPAVPEAKIIIDRVVEELENGFVACERCGDQEDTATLDCMTDLKRLKALLSTPTTPQADGCEWHTDGNGCWMGACGKEFWFEEGGPFDNGMKYCLSCGKPCIEVGDPDEQSGGQDNAL